MSSSKIEEVGEARRSMNAVEGLTDYGLQFTDANPLLTFIPLSRCSYPTAGTHTPQSQATAPLS